MFVAVDNFSSETLPLVRISRQQMGAYLCIASNEVPPAVSKRISLSVNCEFYTDAQAKSSIWGLSQPRN